MTLPYSLDLASLARDYASGALTPAQVVSDIYAAIASAGALPVWIHLAGRDEALAAAAEVEKARAAGAALPLYGIPFAVKDNIDVAGLPTTAACPAFARIPRATAQCVRRLQDAGALVIGKTNLDQFATGLTGTRSPYGACVNPFDSRYIAGGSSSGSAVAVATGQVELRARHGYGGLGPRPRRLHQHRGTEADARSDRRLRAGARVPLPRLRLHPGAHLRGRARRVRGRARRRRARPLVAGGARHRSRATPARPRASACRAIPSSSAMPRPASTSSARSSFSRGAAPLPCRSTTRRSRRLRGCSTRVRGWPSASPPSGRSWTSVRTRSCR